MRKISAYGWTRITVIAIISALAIGIIIPWSIAPRYSLEFGSYETKIISIPNALNYVKFEDPEWYVDVGLHKTMPNSSYYIDQKEIYYINHSITEEINSIYCLNGSLLSAYWGGPEKCEILPNSTEYYNPIVTNIDENSGLLQVQIRQEQFYSVRFSEQDQSYGYWYVKVTRSLPSFDTVDSTHMTVFRGEENQFEIRDYAYMTVLSKQSASTTIEFRFKWAKWFWLGVVVSYLAFDSVAMIILKIVKNHVKNPTMFVEKSNNNKIH